MGNKVLVVEENKTLRVVLSFAFRSKGHATVLSADAETALAKLPGDSPDVVICDVNLPGMDGAEFTHVVRSSPLLAHTPIVLLGDDDGSDEHAADAWVTKPFDPVEVVELAEKLASSAG